jgi:lipid-binding SYLF domain-containing protein
MKMTSMLLVSAFALSNASLWAGTGHQDSIDRLRMSSEVIHASLDAPDKGIPEEVLSGAKCIVVIPHLVKGGLIFGGEHGRGIASCRTGGRMTAHWTCRGRCITAEFELAGKQVLKTLVVHHQHDDVDAFNANLQSPAASADGDECRRAPAFFCTACGNAAAMLSTNHEAALDQMGNHNDAFGIV